MKLQITAQAYHLRYVVDEDRIILSVDFSAEQELGMAMTRRLTRNLVTALAKFVFDRDQAVKTTAPQVRDTILDFEHNASVANAKAEGTMREEPQHKEKQPVAPAKLVRGVKLAGKPDGGVQLVFDDSERALLLDVAADRVHMVIATFVQMAERAGWDFPPIASWLDALKNTGQAVPKTVN